MGPADVAQGEQRIPERRSGLLGALTYRDFRLLWVGGFLINVGYWMQFTSLSLPFAYMLGGAAGLTAIAWVWLARPALRAL